MIHRDENTPYVKFSSSSSSRNVLNVAVTSHVKTMVSIRYHQENKITSNCENNIFVSQT
jgi:hypothetical protein